MTVRRLRAVTSIMLPAITSYLAGCSSGTKPHMRIVPVTLCNLTLLCDALYCSRSNHYYRGTVGMSAMPCYACTDNPQG